MKQIVYNEKKNRWLQKTRKISFERIIELLTDENNLLDDVRHPQEEKYSNQRIFIIQINKYAYLVPYVEDEKKIFLKTAFPSRKATKKYLTKK